MKAHRLIHMVGQSMAMKASTLWMMPLHRTAYTSPTGAAPKPALLLMRLGSGQVMSLMNSSSSGL